ncbi:dockerin type I domain-containing protein [bacterium]|nr:dockerin type I domain-containing protein [bacterium]
MSDTRYVLSRLFALCVSLLVLPGLARGANLLKVLPATAQPGADVSVIVGLSCESNVAGLSFEVHFDPSKLTFKSAARGAAAEGLVMTDPTEFTVGDSSVTEAAGKLVIQMIDSSLTHPVTPGTDREVLLLSFSVAAGASGSVPVTLSNASLSGAAGEVLAVGTVDGAVTVSSGQTTDAALKVSEVRGPAGSDVRATVTVTSSKDISAASFSLMFDRAKLQVKSVSRGADAPGSDSLGLAGVDIPAANEAGRLDVWLVDFYLDKPVKAGSNRELLKVTFTIAKGATQGDIPLSLARVALAAVEAGADIELTHTETGGKVTVGAASGDVSGDGVINVFDLLDLLKVLSGANPSSGATDLNSDGKTDVFDLLELLKKLSGK